MNQNNSWHKNRIHRSLVLFSLLLVCGLTGCDKETMSENATTTEAVSTYQEMRPTGETVVYQYNENVNTAFFEFSVGNPQYERYMTIGEELFEIHEGYVFAICDFTITNTMDESITMFLDDFRVTWKEGSSDYGYGFSTVGDDAYMEDTFTIAPSETIEKKIMFKVPKDEIVTLYYEECYADDFIGNRYTMKMQP